MDGKVKVSESPEKAVLVSARLSSLNAYGQ